MKTLYGDTLARIKRLIHLEKLTSAFPQRISIPEDNQILYRLVFHEIPLVVLIVMQNGILVNSVASNGVVDTDIS